MTNCDTNMISYSDYYEANLYKLQDGILNIVRTLGAPFYLTGGTALSRGYYQHRYSDDLDFFVNADSDFNRHVDSVLSALKQNGYGWDSEIGFMKTVDFVTLIVAHPGFSCNLKLDFVNDVAAHFGDIKPTNVFYRTDSVENILSNKITAIFRLSAKDVVDIREICLHENFDWEDVFKSVREKELGIEADQVAEIIEGVPESAFNSIKWIKKVDFETFKNDVSMIAQDMLNLKENSLCI